MEGKVTLSVINNIATIEFFHPQSNSMPGELLRNLARTIEDAGNNKEVNVISWKTFFLQQVYVIHHIVPVQWLW